MLGLTIKEDLISPSRYSIKSPSKMKPKGVCIHNTYNNAPASNEISYMKRNNNYVSFHYAVDEKEAIYAIPEDRITWHAGTKDGNYNYISIEIARSTSNLNTYLKAEDNGAKLTAIILNKYGWGVDKLKKHQDFSGKYCPHRMLELGRWNRFKENVENYLEQLKGVKLSSKKEDDILNKLKIDYVISCNDPKEHMYEVTRVSQYFQLSKLNYAYTDSTKAVDYSNLGIPIIAIGGNKNQHTSYAKYFIKGRPAADLFHSSKANWDKLKI